MAPTLSDTSRIMTADELDVMRAGHDEIDRRVQRAIDAKAALRATCRFTRPDLED